jgi:hypothetical protein
MPTVTSENKAEFDREFLTRKGILKDEKMPSSKKMEAEQYERAKSHPKFAKLRAALGKKGAVDAILKEMNDAQSRQPQQLT